MAYTGALHYSQQPILWRGCFLLWKRGWGNEETGEYAGVVLEGINPVKLAEGIGVEGMHVQEESRLAAAIEHGLNVVERERRPFLLNIRLPLGLPEGGRAAAQFRLADAMSTVQAHAD